jgi:glutaredoxin
MTKPLPRARAILSATLLALLVILPTLAGLYCFANRDRIFPARNTVVVYGRETCGITSRVRSQLEARGVPYVFADIDIRAVDDELDFKLGPDFNEPTITLPVVHVAGKLLLTPTVDQVLQELSQAKGQAARDYSTFLNGSDPPPRH